MKVNDKSVSLEVEAFEDIPYPSMPYAITQPSRLAAVASLYAIQSAAVETARVLELGCASGGNLIPLAARFPASRFLGVDIGRRHIEDGQSRIGELGLTNIRLQHADISELSFAPNTFDYIICHGVFSWVLGAVQNAIFRICRESLSENGVAAISYNVLPGWHLRNAVRAICLRHTGQDESPRQRAASVRAILDDIAYSSSDADPYGLLLRQEAKRIAHRPASYILGEFLADTNAPLHVEDFLSRARGSGLDYIGEADLDAAVPEIFRPELQSRLQRYGGDQSDARERYIDLFTGRTFRTSLLVQAGARRTRARNHGQFRALHFSANIRVDPANGGFLDEKGRAIRAKHASVQHALDTLAQTYPCTRTFLQLLGEGGRQDEAQLIEALALLTAVGQVDISTTALTTGRAEDAKPVASQLARIEAASGQPWITGLHHRPVGVPPAARLLLPHLTGASDRSRLLQVLVETLRSGSLQATDDDHLTGFDPDERAARCLNRALTYLAANALLTPSAVEQLQLVGARQAK
ncbi:methyltransferase [alpha proteobacterium U9-1i]|nr:methyltransferase [alpha proteobacterium U9-1i]